MATYSRSSPWANTNQNGLYLELINMRPVPAEADDGTYTIETQYTHRPDLLAYDLYNNPKLWWVFIQRNMDVLKDPVFDFEPGVTIRIPKKDNIDKYLGV